MAGGRTGNFPYGSHARSAVNGVSQIKHEIAKNNVFLAGGFILGGRWT
jgi:hypothetical protein